MTTEEAIKRLESFRDHLCAGNPIWDVNEVAEVFDKAIEALKAQEPLTDDEQRIFLAAMDKEEKVCKKVDDEWKGVLDENDTFNLVDICHSIERKVKKALWG